MRLLILKSGRFQLIPYVTLRDFVTATKFLRLQDLALTKAFTFSGQIKPAADDLLLVSGDIVTFDIPGEKALISARDVIKKLKRLVGLYFDSMGSAMIIGERKMGDASISLGTQAI